MVVVVVLRLVLLATMKEEVTGERLEPLHLSERYFGVFVFVCGAWGWPLHGKCVAACQVVVDPHSEVVVALVMRQIAADVSVRMT